MKKIVSLIISLLLFVGVATPCFANQISVTSESNATNLIENPVNNFFDEIIDMDFAERGVIYVTMHHSISDVGKIYTEANFPELNIESIEDITSVNINDKKEDYGNNFRNILKITLKNKDDNSVVNAIKKLQERANEDIYWAEPEYCTNLTDSILEDFSEIDYSNVEIDDYWYSVIHLLDNANGNVLDYISANISNFDEGTPIKVALVDTSGVESHDDFEITVQDENGHTDTVSILENEIDLRSPNAPAVVRGHGTVCARLLSSTSIINNTQTISITPIIPPGYTHADSGDDRGKLDGLAYIAKIVECLNGNNNDNNDDIFITSMSLSRTANEVGNQSTAYSILNNYKGLLVASASNKGINVDGSDFSETTNKPFPAALACDNIVSVGASNESDTIWVGSNYGNYSVDLFAPGENTVFSNSDTNNDGIPEDYYDSGTSGATPIVAGTAALLKYINPDLTNLQIKAILMNTTDRNNTFIGKCVSGGRLNAYEAVRIAHGLATNSLSEEDIKKSEYLYTSNVPTTENADGETVLDITGETFTIDKCVSNRESVTLPQTFRGKNVTQINTYAFDVNTCTESVTVPSTVQVSPCAFNQSDSLTTVSFADGTTTIPQSTFAHCHNVKNVYIPNSVESFGTASLNDALIFTNPDSITDDSFLYNFVCENGYSLGIVSGNTIIDYYAGSNDASRDITLPSYLNGIKIETIGGHAFDEADNVVSFEIPNTVKTISYRAFRNCDLLRTVIIPSSVTSISNSMNSTIVEGSTNAVIYCARGTYAYVYSLTTDATFIYVSLNSTNKTASIDGIKESSNGGTEYYFPKTFYGYTVTSIASYAFGTNILDEKRVTRIYIPYTVESIGTNAFSSCANLTDIYIYSDDTELGSNCLPPYNRSSITVHCYMSSPAFLYAIGNGYSYSLL